jgi:ribosome-binding factor A
MRRPEKLAEALKEVIAEVVGYELDDPRVTMVTVTEVTVSDDIRDAKVYVLIDGSEAEINEALKALKHASVFVRQQVTLNLSLRYAPHLHFVRDTAEENASKITQILGGLDIKPEIEERNESDG